MICPTLLFAVPHEAAALVHSLQGRLLNRGGGWYSVENTPLKIHCIGMGSTASANARLALGGSRQDTPVLLCGYAGALDPALPHAALVADGWRPDGGWPDSVAIASCETISTVAATPPEKSALRSRTGAAICDMEFSWVRGVCQELGLPCGFLRAISDTASDTLPARALAASYCHATQKPTILPLLWHLALYPSDLAPFSRFVSGLSQARQSLSQVLLDSLITPAMISFKP